MRADVPHPPSLADARAEFSGDSLAVRARDELLALVPSQAHTVLDVGCGSGDAGRILQASGREVYSLDFSQAALMARPPRAIRARAGALPIASRSMDLVLSLEFLEYLPAGTLHAVAAEMERVARRWMLIGVPDREDLERHLVECPRCRYRFHRLGHLNRFDRDRLVALFPSYRLTRSSLLGPVVRDYPRTLLWMRQRIAHRFSEAEPSGTIRCPRCGETQFGRFRHNLLSLFVDAVHRGVGRSRPYWLLVLLERQAG